MCLCYVFKSLNGLNKCNWFMEYPNAYNTRSNNTINLVVPFVQSYQNMNSLRILGPKLWNELSVDIRESQSYNCFKVMLKQKMLSISP